MVNEGMVSSKTRHTVFLFKFSSPVCKHGGCSCRRSSPILTANSGKVVGKGGVNNILHVPPGEEIKWSRFRGKKTPSDRVAFFLNNQQDALIIPILFCYKTIHVSDIFSALHQEVSTVYSALVSFIQVFMTVSKKIQDRTQFHPDSAWKLSS